MAQPSYYEPQYSSQGVDGRYASTSAGLTGGSFAGYSGAADAGYSVGYATSQLPPVSAQNTGYGAGQFLDYRGGATSGQNTQATELGYAGSSSPELANFGYPSASTTQAATGPVYTTATSGGSYSMNSSAFDAAKMGYLSTGQSSFSQGAFGASSFTQGAPSMLQTSAMPQAGSFTAAPQASFSYQGGGQDTFTGLPTSGSFVAGGFDPSGGQVG